MLVSLASVSDRERQLVAERIADRVADVPGVTVGGSARANAEANDIVFSDIERAELLAAPLVFLLSILVFRSLVAALLPLLVAGISIGFTILVLRILSHQLELSVYAINLTTALGLGLAIDYALFMVSRFREELARGGTVDEAIAATRKQAGHTVLFSALTVAAALAALLVFPQRQLYSLGLGGAIVALASAAVATQLLPLLLRRLGPRIDAFTPKALARGRDREAADGARNWERLTRWVLRRPGRVALVAIALTGGLAWAGTGVKTFTIDGRVLPAHTDSSRVAATVQAKFPAISVEPSLVIVRADRAAQVRQAALALPGVRGVDPPRPIGGGRVAVSVSGSAAATSPAGEALATRLRATVAPYGGQVTGTAAQAHDIRAAISDRVPLAAAIIVGLTLLLMFAMTGSVVLPVLTVVLNVLTLGATLGILRLIFQDGRLEGLLGFTSLGALEVTQPVVIGAIAFGLSTDYGVFVLARVREALRAGESVHEAIVTGLTRTGRIVTAAAVLFAVAVGANVTSEIVFIKMLGLGAAAAVLIDATIVRAFIVPGLLGVLGRWAWWAPQRTEIAPDPEPSPAER